MEVFVFSTLCNHLIQQTSTTSSTETSPSSPVLNSIALGWLVAMVTLPRHSGRPPVRAGTAEGVEKGGVSPLVLFAGVTGHRQEAAQRVLRLRLCRVRCQVIPNRLHVQVPVAGSGNEKKKEKSLNSLLSANKHLCSSSSPNSPSLLPCKTPPEDCVPMRGHTKDSLPVTCLHCVHWDGTPPPRKHCH